MIDLPCHLLNEILFRLERRDMAMMRCTNRYLRRHMSNDPYFEKEYKSFLLPNHSSGNVMVVGYCSGLLLLFIEKLLFVVQPFTSSYRLVNYTWSRVLFNMFSQGVIDPDKRERIGFTVDEIDTNTQTYKIFCLIETKEEEEARTMYQFEVSSGDSFCILSKTTITCHSSELVKGMRPVYLDQVLYWLRNDGSIIAFNTVTEKAQLIQTEFPSTKTLLCAAPGLTLLTTTEQGIFVYAFKNTTKSWLLVRRILLDQKMRMMSWKVAAYDGKYLVLTEATKDVMVVHEYDLRANKWTIIQELSKCNNNQEIYQLRRSSSSVIGVNNMTGMKNVWLQVQPHTCTLINRLALFLTDIFPCPEKRPFFDERKIYHILWTDV